MRRSLIMIALLLAVGVGCSGSGDGCNRVVNTRLDGDLHLAGKGKFIDSGKTFTTGARAFFVAGPDGALWMTSISPKNSAETGGLLFALNPNARRDSEAGADAPIDAPIYNGLSAADPKAQKAVDCAS